jgi:hypothetical protein
VSRIDARAFRWLLEKLPVTLKFARWLLARDRYVIAIGGHGGHAFDDNSRAFALHLRGDPGYMVVWFAGDNHSAKMARGSKLRVLRKGRWKANIVLLIAHAAVYSHNINDLDNSATTRVPWRIDVHLGHGVIGLKRANRRETKPQWVPDIAIASSPFEAGLKSSTFTDGSTIVLTTGLPKHDALVGTHAAQERRELQVLYAPTWRDWLEQKPSDLAISYHLDAISRLAEAMPSEVGPGRSIKVTYLLHKNARMIRDDAEARCTNVGFDMMVSSEVDVGHLLLTSDWLISDYSGLIWDFMIQGKPTARYVFDESLYSKLTGGYPEMEKIAAPITFKVAGDVWSFLSDPDAARTASQISASVSPMADGMASERLEMRLAEAIRNRKLQTSAPTRFLL